MLWLGISYSRLRLDPRFLDMLHVGVTSQLASHSFCDTRPVSSVVEGEVSELVPSEPRLHCQILVLVKGFKLS